MSLCGSCLLGIHKCFGVCDCGSCSGNGNCNAESQLSDKLSDNRLPHSRSEVDSLLPDTTFDAGSGEEDSSELDENWRTGGATYRRHKREAAIRDAESTGRKRAAKLYPLDRTANCEWLGQTNVGGGTKPINGCPVERNCRQAARHHGPDKNTLNNERGNVHRIGHLCHNRWHAANDPDYDIEKGLKGD